MKIKTEQEIVEIAKKCIPKVDGTYNYIEGYSQAQSDLVESLKERNRVDEEAWLTCINTRDERIKELEEEVKFLKASNGRLEEARICHLDTYQEAVEDIDDLSFTLMEAFEDEQDRGAYKNSREVRTKYGLDKQERKG